jgi:cytochrome P450
MNYLQLLDTIRSITGRRQHDRFPAVEPAVAVFRRDGAAATFVVYDALQAKAVLQSPHYRQFNFLEQILTIAKPERTGWIRRFCDIGLIMLDGPEHERRRPLMQRSLEKCALGVKAIPDDEMVAVIEDGIAAEPFTSASMASRLVVFLFSRAIAELVGKPVELSARDLFAVDFFNPFPTLSSLSRSNEALGKCCEAIGFEELDEPTQAAVLSLLVMGVSPLHALLTALLNAYAAGLQAGLERGEAVRAATGWNSYEIVPTNFVMRTCVATDVLGQEVVQPGDRVYLFLGSATGCPFSRLTSVPFGAGLHHCSGAALTQVMTNAVRNGLMRVDSDLSRITPSEEVKGKAAAFLGFGAAS